MARILYFLLIFICNVSFSKEQLEINADQFTYDKDNTRIYATGNVEIIDKEFKLYAEKVFVNNSSKVLSARENIKIFNNDGSILKADKIVADHNLKNAIIENNYLYLPTSYELNKNYLRIAAKKVERRNETWEKMDFGSFTACEICYNEKEKRYDEPLIKLKAKKIIHDKEELNVKYYDVFLDVKGQSVFYLPYFSHPSPLVKRKAGFLAPNFFQTYYFGLGSDLTYYYPFNDYHDITISPKFSQKKNPALYIEHRKNFRNGQITNVFSGTIENQKVNQIKEDRKRGHVKSSGQFYFNSTDYIKYKVHRTTDANYLNTYKYGYTDILESNLKLESLRGNNFYSFQSFAFQDIRKEFDQKKIPKILPRLVLDLNSDYSLNNLNFSTQLELANLARSEGTNSKKLFITQKFYYPTILKDGTFLKFGSIFNGGLYSLNKFNNSKNGKFEYHKYQSNFFLNLQLKCQSRFKQQKKTTNIITPKILAIKNFRNSFFRGIPDESNINNFDFDYMDLYNLNRFQGNDRFDQSSRIDYGVSFLRKNNNDNQLTSIELGQSYHFEKNKFLNENTGINEKFSDIVGVFEVVPTSNIKLDSYFAIKKRILHLKQLTQTFYIDRKILI